MQAEETARTITSRSTSTSTQAALEEGPRGARWRPSSPTFVLKQVQGHALRIGKELARRAPSLEDSIIRWLDVLNRGKLVVERHDELNRAVGKVGDVGRQATVGLIVVGQLIGTAIVMAIMLQPSLAEFQGVAYAAMIAFAITLVVSFIVLFRVFLNRGDD